MSTAKYGHAAKKFTDAGIKGKWLLPIAPVGALISKTAALSEAVLGKAPGRFNDARNVWSGLGGRAIFDGVTKAEFDEFQDWPTPNVGILGRAFPGIDNDAGSDKARLFVEKIISEAFGKNAFYGERIRGKGPRRLYAFSCLNPSDMDYVVRTRHISYKLAGDDTEHKLDVIGLGGQYVAAGIHPSGDKYEWAENASLTNPKHVDRLTDIDNDDVERFLEIFAKQLEKAGGEILRATGGRSGGFQADVKDLEPVMDFDTVMEGLDLLPNTEENFLHRDDFVSALSAIRSALGEESLDPRVEDEIREWATQDPDWCDEEYFDKVWNSLETVRTPQDSLDRLFRRNGIRHHVKEKFDDRGRELNTKIQKKQEAKKEARGDILSTVASRYIFGRINLRDGQSQYTMRDRWDVDHEWSTLAWWKYELAESDQALLDEIQEEDRYASNKIGLANFLRDLSRAHPEVFYSKEVKHPAYEKGEIFSENMPDGTVQRSVNMRYLSQTIRAARKEDKNRERSASDLKHLLDFANRLFGPMVKYELDTLAYMAQTGDRPGNLLFLVGDSGVGKSLWMNIQAAMFDGTGPEQTGIIDGQKLHNESARRFAFANAEGCRIISVKELPDGANARDMASITSLLKQVVDAGPEGDWLQIERKRENIQSVRNFARVLISSNYMNALHVDAQDRRIFYVGAAITEDNKPPRKFYERIVDILGDPTRLACFWRYLMQRDIGNYSRHTAPPVSVEKAERVIAEIASGPTRHARAVIEWFKASNRDCFTATEFLERMSEVANAEYVNSGGTVDDRTVYKSDGFDKKGSNVLAMSALKTIKPNFAVKLKRDLRTNKSRYPAVYVMADRSELALDMLDWQRDEVIDYVERDETQGMPEHPMPMYRKQ